jgi:general stress protein 26
VAEVLSESEMFWLSTVRRDGRPHVTPLPAVWLDGTLHFCAGALEQKSKNLEFNPQCILTTGTNQLGSGLDVVVEGTAARVTGREQLQRLAELWKSKLDWDFEVGDEAFRDADGRDGLVFGVAPTKVLSFGKNPYSQTRYRFPG